MVLSSDSLSATKVTLVVNSDKDVKVLFSTSAGHLKSNSPGEETAISRGAVVCVSNVSVTVGTEASSTIISDPDTLSSACLENEDVVHEVSKKVHESQ